MILENDMKKISFMNSKINKENIFKGANMYLPNTEEVKLVKRNKKANLLKANDAPPHIEANINFNVNYSAGTLSEGQILTLHINTNADKKMVFHSSCGEGLSYRTRIYYIENNQAYIVQDSYNILGYYDVDSCVTKGGTYHIQIDIVSGSNKFNFVAQELSKFSDNEPCDNLFTALGLTANETIEARDFFDYRMDHDFYMLEVNEPKEMYMNFAYDNSNVMNTDRYSPSVGYIVYYWNGSNISQIDAGSFNKMTFDKKIILPSAGKYIFILYPLDELPFGQLEENYNFAVRDDLTAFSTMPSGIQFNLSVVAGQIDQGRFDSYQGRTCPFWVNGTAVRLNGIIEKWDGMARQVLIKVEDELNHSLTLIGTVKADGSFNIVIPLFTQKAASIKSFEYHGENMYWNTVTFLDKNGNSSMVFARLGNKYHGKLNIAACLNTAPLEH